MTAFNIDKYLKSVQNGRTKKRQISPELQPYVDLWVAVVSQAVKDNGPEWIKSQEFKGLEDFLPFDIRI